jgi:hypothetical protein
MRLKQSRVRHFYHKQRKVQKDSEGNTSEVFEDAGCFRGECWEAGGKLQVEMYGHRVSNIMNIRIGENYCVKTDAKGMQHYVLQNGSDLMIGNGIHVFTPNNSNPDYKIISIKPQRFLRLEVERL